MARQRIVIIATPHAADARALGALFDIAEGWTRVYAVDGADTLDKAMAHIERLELLLIDISLLIGGGLEAVRRVQAPGTIDCPPVVLLLPEDGYLSLAMPEDADFAEYLLMPIQPRIAAQRVASVLALHRYRRKDLSYHHAIARDPLLGLLTGRSLSAAVDRELIGCGGAGLMIYLNIDGTRAINERSGYHFGDLVMVDFARALQDALPSDAIIGRPHGDTFCAFLPFRPDEMENLRLLERLRATLRRTYPDAPGGPQLVTCCIGAAGAPRDGDGFQALYEAAEMANSAAKQLGRDIVLVYDEALLRWPGIEAHGEEIVSVPMGERYVSVMRADGESLEGYEYVPMPTDMEPDDYQEALDRMASLPDRSVIHATRVDLKRFFGRMVALERAGVAAPRYFFYAVLHGDQSEMLPQLLQDALTDYPVDPARITISIHQGMATEMSRGRLEQLAREVHGLGFALGIYGVGEQFVANACYMDHVFDRVLLSPGFANDLTDGLYPPEFVDRVIGFFSQVRRCLCFPSTLSLGARRALVDTLGDGFTYCADLLADEAAVAGHAAAHARAPVRQVEAERLAFRLGEDRYDEIFRRSGIILFDWQPHSDSLALSQSFEATYGALPPGTDERAIIERVMHPEDRGRLIDLLTQVKHGRPSAESVFRVRRPDGGEDGFTWRRFFLISSRHRNGVVAHVYGISFDVDREQRAMRDMIRLAETDPLTQLFNRGATEGRIRGCLEGEGREERHALMIVDLDNFKSINDRLGHIEGDNALRFIAREMKRLFRKEDVVGRIGGDEFMVFVRGVSEADLIEQRARSLCEAARAGNPDWRLGCTVGIARYPEDGDTFQTLYAKADLALYQAKERGKNGWAIFGEGEGRAP